jgi:hypothetical protein
MAESSVVPSLAEDGRECVSFPSGNGKHSGELTFDHQQTLVGRRVGVVVDSRVANGGDQPLAGGQPSHDPLLEPVRVGQREHLIEALPLLPWV